MHGTQERTTTIVTEGQANHYSHSPAMLLQFLCKLSYTFQCFILFQRLVNCNWLYTVEVFALTTEPPTEGHDFELTCTVTIDTEMMTNLDVTVHSTLQWADLSDTLDSSRAPVLSEHRITVGNPTVDENKTSRTLSFTPLSLSDGGSYTCTAAVNVPELSVTLSKSATIDLLVAKMTGRYRVYT